MAKKILVTFWIPPEVAKSAGGDFELTVPKEEVVGLFSRAEILKMLPGYDGVMIANEKADREFIDAGPGLKVIGRFGVGCDGVDCEYAGGKGIAVINTPNAVTQPTAELAVAIMMDVARGVTRTDKLVREAGRCVQPFLFDASAVSLHGKTLGIIGFGRIGRAVGEKARGLGMKVVYSDVFPAPADLEERMGVRRLETEALLRTSDFVTLHCQYTPENHHLINAGTLAMMKPSAFLVNASRGKMVDEAALARALRDKVIMGAAIDVFEFEPEVHGELFALDNIVLTPHIGTWSYDARVAMGLESLGGMMEYLKGGNPPNVFNRELLKK